MDANNDNSSRTATVQHITKKSSDDLLRKFAEMSGEDDDANEAKKLELARVLRRKSKRRRTRRDIEGGNSCESPSHYNSSSTLVERRSLLPPVTRKSALLRQLGIGRSQLKARDIKNKSILASIKKTWRKTLEGASKVLLEKHCSRHRRLINDLV
ncbi:uncharacterized protein [Populus alba]|uniref:Uncharacterized protein n=1 Tax=Populus alba TaxID=43335 RepID=A0A4U5NKQ6_POPAL|nr:uncharacterized protein LOC118051312 [Populus alba]TKR84169.1 hypothetical protein D5086_0000262020 [Populus alba]